MRTGQGGTDEDAALRRLAVYGGVSGWVCQDYAPEVDHGETAKIAAQHAILQADGQRLLLLAGWPREWDVDFRLAAPNRTTVEGAVRDGQLTRLVVTPPERERDVVNLLGVDVEGPEQRPQEKRRQPQLLRQP